MTGEWSGWTRADSSTEATSPTPRVSASGGAQHNANAGHSSASSTTTTTATTTTATTATTTNTTPLPPNVALVDDGGAPARARVLAFRCEATPTQRTLPVIRRVWFTSVDRPDCSSPPDPTTPSSPSSTFALALVFDDWHKFSDFKQARAADLARVVQSWGAVFACAPRKPGTPFVETDAVVTFYERGGEFRVLLPDRGERVLIVEWDISSRSFVDRRSVVVSDVRTAEIVDLARVLPSAVAVPTLGVVVGLPPAAPASSKSAVAPTPTPATTAPGMGAGSGPGGVPLPLAAANATWGSSSSSSNLSSSAWGRASPSSPAAW